MQKMVQAPKHFRKIACVDKTQTSIIRAFQLRGFTVHEISLMTRSDIMSAVEKCYVQGGFSFLWTHQNLSPTHWAKLRPYI